MKKLKAGSLQLVTFVVVVIALLLASFVLLTHIHKQFRIRTNHTIETVTLVNNGIDELLKNESFEKDTTSLNLNDKDYKSLKIHKSYWGAFEKVHSKAKIKNKTLSKVALVGGTFDSNSTALYVKENNKPLVLVGQTTIKGNAFLPKRGVKSGNISGQSYYGEKYIYGNILQSKDLPKLDIDLLNYLEDMKREDFNSQKLNFINVNSSKTHQNSFENPLQLVYSTTDIFLSDMSIKGHIMIKSKTNITVDSSAQLQDVILSAPVIELKPNVTGRFQAIATERLSIDKNVSLEYPSALVLLQDYLREAQNNTGLISIEDQSEVSGQIIVLGKTQRDNYDAQIKVNANAIVEGTIYCEQNLELRGTVYGTVFTDNFIIKEGGSVFQNHLYNAIIDSGKLTSEFVGLHLDKAKKGIAKWLY